MKKILFILLCTAIVISCKKQLEVGNPNVPTLDKANTESGFLSLVQGGTYINGFQQGAEDINGTFYDGVPGHFWSGATAFHDLMGDVIGAEAANVFLNQIAVPEYVTLDNSTKVNNPNSPLKQPDLIRQVNTNANQGQNFLYHEWTYMYSLNKASNRSLALVDKVAFSGNAETRKNAIKAWSYWWKGFAYARIGSIYYAGIIDDADIGTNGNYVTKEQIIAESNANLDKAAALLQALTDDADYEAMIGRLIPNFFKLGKGGVPTPQMWIRTINTLKARNILVNKTVASMTPADWTSIASLVDNGVKTDDNVFTARSSADFLTSGTTAIKSSSILAGGATYKVSERLIQDYKTGDKRFENNYAKTVTWIGNSDRGNIFNTRYTLVSGGNGLPGVVVINNSDLGQGEYYMAGTYEENELMKAEAKIYSGSVEDGLGVIDALRTYQGAGLVAVKGAGLTTDQAKEELRRERRVVLAYRGLAFYDARRWGISEDVSRGGGRTKAIVVGPDGIVNNNATINYNFLDYWDVPDNELAYNPNTGSVAVKNPK
jgi:starch-binding outer membrane protein, SusD/RagB family